MPSKVQILKILAGEVNPLSRGTLAEKMGLSTYRGFQTQLDRFKKYGLIEHNEERQYWITAKGRTELLEEFESAKLAKEQAHVFLSITEADLAKLEQKEFNQVWEALGKIIRKRAGA